MRKVNVVRKVNLGLVHQAKTSKEEKWHWIGEHSQSKIKLSLREYFPKLASLISRFTKDAYGKAKTR